MSDPVTKTEIEDVLSSIRRLVSEESRMEPRRVSLREPAEHDRLVLTPALRVAEPPESDFEPQQEDALGAVPLDEDADDTAWDTEPDRDGEDDTPGDGATVDDEPWRDPDATLFASARSNGDGDPDEPDWVADADAGEPDVADDHDLWEDATDDDAPDWDDEALPDDRDQSDLESEDWESETDIDTERAGDFDDADDTDDFEDSGATDEPGVSDDATGDHQYDEPLRADTARTATLSAKIQALEAAIGRTQDQWEPDGAGLDDYSGTRVETIAWEDHANDPEPATPPSAKPEARHPDVDTGKTEESSGLFPADEAFLDEESLRELVADIVREELQGALGERITRNVRKLVRREIHRALTAQEME